MIFCVNELHITLLQIYIVGTSRSILNLSFPKLYTYLSVILSIDHIRVYIFLYYFLKCTIAVVLYVEICVCVAHCYCFFIKVEINT